MGSDWLGPILQIGGAIIGGSVGGPQGAAIGSQIGGAIGGATGGSSSSPGNGVFSNVTGGSSSTAPGGGVDWLGTLASVAPQAMSGLLGNKSGQTAPAFLSLAGGGQLGGMSPQALNFMSAPIQPSQMPQMQMPQMGGGGGMQLGQIAPSSLDFSQMPSAFNFQGGLPPMPQVSQIPQPEGVPAPQLQQAQGAQFQGPQPPYAPSNQSSADEYTQLLNYIRMNSFQKPQRG